MNHKKTILITGANSGLGQAVALHFAKKGWNVAATMRKLEPGAGLSAIPNVQVFLLDVTLRDTIESAMETAASAFGRIDVVLNNAGLGVYGALELTSEQAIEQAYHVNVRGVINVIRASFPYFRRQGGGMIINVSSVMGLSTALPLGSLYNMSKFAIEGLTEGLYFELKPLNISLHLVEPGGFSSSFGKNTVFSKSDLIHDYDTITQNVANAMAAAAKSGALPGPDAIVSRIYELAIGKKKSFRNVVGKDAKILLILRRILPIRSFLDMLTKRFNGKN